MPPSKKRSASHPSETPKKCLRRTEGETPANCLAEDVEGIVDDVGPEVADDSGANMTAGGDAPCFSCAHVTAYVSWD